MNFDPSLIAAADQDLSLTRQRLGEVVVLWREDRGLYDDPVERISRLMAHMEATQPIALRALLACAIDQIAEAA